MPGLEPGIQGLQTQSERSWIAGSSPAMTCWFWMPRMTNEADQKTRTVTVRIEGRVQGVYYRAWTHDTAQSLGLDGWVRNAGDGSVEAVFSGPAAQVEQMLERCKDGPRDAKVTAVTIIDEGGAPPSGFKVIASDRWR
jgi:acylphosphatase